MALKRIIVTDFDYEAEYHVVILTNIDWMNKVAHIEVLTWKNEKARRNNKQPVGVTVFDWKGEDFPFQAGDNVQAKAYQKIKTLAAWSASEDA